MYFNWCIRQSNLIFRNNESGNFRGKKYIVTFKYDL